MTLESPGPDDLARAGFIESLGRSAIGPDLGHYGYPPLTEVLGSRSPQACSKRLAAHKHAAAAQCGTEMIRLTTPNPVRGILRG